MQIADRAAANGRMVEGAEGQGQAVARPYGQFVAKTLDAAAAEDAIFTCDVGTRRSGGGDEIIDLARTNLFR